MDTWLTSAILFVPSCMSLEEAAREIQRISCRTEHPDKNTQKPRTNPDWTNLASQIASTRLALRTCEESLRRFTVTGDGFVGSLELDAVVSRFMKAHEYPCDERRRRSTDGTLTGNHGYTLGASELSPSRNRTRCSVIGITRMRPAMYPRLPVSV